jgi:hypothetical protein
MADLKISQLTALVLVTVASTDVLAVVDVSATQTKKDYGYRLGYICQWC